MLSPSLGLSKRWLFYRITTYSPAVIHLSFENGNGIIVTLVMSSLVDFELENRIEKKETSIYMIKGRIVELRNNYGTIAIDAYGVENEWIPFEVEKYMIETINGKEYIKYTEEVELEIVQSQGVRERDLKVAKNVKFIGDKWELQERLIEKDYCKIVKKRLKEYSFSYPSLENDKFEAWLIKKNFQPRMLEYLSAGIFTPTELLKSSIQSNLKLEDKQSEFDVELLFLIDRIDIEFRKNILFWITGIENSYKTYFSKIRLTKDNQDIGIKVIQDWIQKKPKMKKVVKRANNKRKYRDISDEFDYLEYEHGVPFLDFMEQLELNELSELITAFYDEYVKIGLIPDILRKMKECIGFISDLGAIRNSAAHGRSILPAFMDPDYNGNWDLEFDNIEVRGNVEKWILYDKLGKRWDDLGVSSYKKEIINTLYGNPFRRAWVELN